MASTWSRRAQTLTQMTRFSSSFMVTFVQRNTKLTCIVALVLLEQWTPCVDHEEVDGRWFGTSWCVRWGPCADVSDAALAYMDTNHSILHVSPSICTTMNRNCPQRIRFRSCCFVVYCRAIRFAHQLRFFRELIDVAVASRFTNNISSNWNLKARNWLGKAQRRRQCFSKSYVWGQKSRLELNYNILLLQCC
jgi:hypothetical protein